MLAQPYRESVSAGQTFITSALEDAEVREVLIVTAWLRESGAQLLVPGLEALRARGGTARLLFGIDLLGTSRQGVILARKHFTSIHVVHDPSGRTFHPKMYVAVGRRVGYALIGSNNLTAGGLWHNYEGAVIATFDPRREPELVDGVRRYAQRLLDDAPICKRVTQRVFTRLLDEGWLADEAHDRKRRSEDRPADGSRGRPGSHDPLFTSSNVEKRSRPAPIRAHAHGTTRPLSSQARKRLAVGPDSWWKPLGAGDAQHPLAGNATGNAALTHVPADQDRATFFRNVLFGAETWRRNVTGGKRTELADVEAEVTIGDAELGRHIVTIVYRPYRQARGRATTVLRWGETLLRELHACNVSGWYLLIERADVRAYRLRITPQRPA